MRGDTGLGVRGLVRGYEGVAFQFDVVVVVSQWDREGVRLLRWAFACRRSFGGIRCADRRRLL